MSGTALYVYAIIPASAVDAATAGLMGIDGQAVHAVTTDGVAALAHEGQPIPYQGPDETVKRWILEHSQVVDHAWEVAGTVLPVTFNVLVKPEGKETAADRLRAWLHEHAASTSATLERLRGHVELRIEITLDRNTASAGDDEVRTLRAALAGKPPGLRRLLEKKAEQAERQAADLLADRLYPEYRRRVAGCVQDLTELRRPSPYASADVPVLSTAVLVHRDGVERVGAELARIEHEQPAARIRFLGPWPPYSFAEFSAITREQDTK